MLGSLGAVFWIPSLGWCRSLRHPLWWCCLSLLIFSNAICVFQCVKETLSCFLTVSMSVGGKMVFDPGLALSFPSGLCCLLFLRRRFPHCTAGHAAVSRASLGGPGGEERRGEDVTVEGCCCMLLRVALPHFLVTQLVSRRLSIRFADFRKGYSVPSVFLDLDSQKQNWFVADLWTTPPTLRFWIWHGRKIPGDSTTTINPSIRKRTREPYQPITQKHQVTRCSDWNSMQHFTQAQLSL